MVSLGTQDGLNQQICIVVLIRRPCPEARHRSPGSAQTRACNAAASDQHPAVIILVVGHYVVRCLSFRLRPEDALVCRCRVGAAVIRLWLSWVALPPLVLGALRPTTLVVGVLDENSFMGTSSPYELWFQHQSYMRTGPIQERL